MSLFENPASYLSNPVEAPNPARRKRAVVFTYEIVTPESAEEGDAEERGFLSTSGQQLPLDYADLQQSRPADEDIQNPVSGAEEAAKMILDELGFIEPSSSSWHKGVWYSQADGDPDYATGAETRKAAHLYGFSEREEYWVWQLINAQLRRWRGR